jgi:hypothetical protein
MAKKVLQLRRLFDETLTHAPRSSAVLVSLKKGPEFRIAPPEIFHKMMLNLFFRQCPEPRQCGFCFSSTDNGRT